MREFTVSDMKNLRTALFYMDEILEGYTMEYPILSGINITENIFNLFMSYSCLASFFVNQYIDLIERIDKENPEFLDSPKGK